MFEYFWSKYLFGYSFVSKCWYEYIRIFVRVKILIWIYSDIRSCQKISYEYIRIFVRVIFLTRIYSDIRSYQNPYECHTLYWSSALENLVNNFSKMALFWPLICLKLGPSGNMWVTTIFPFPFKQAVNGTFANQSAYTQKIHLKVSFLHSCMNIEQDNYQNELDKKRAQGRQSVIPLQ